METAIVKAQVVTPVVIEAGRRRELTAAEVQLIQNTVAKGTTPEQFSMFLWFCRKHEFDPLAKEVYCILFKVTKHHEDYTCPGPPYCTQPKQGDGIGAWHSGKEMVIVTGIGGMRGKAARDHRTEYGSTDEPIYKWFDPPQFTPSGKKIPETCSVSVWKKGDARATTATLYWEEFAPRDLNDSRFEFWNKSPKNQLAKCAEAQALRKAYPDLTNIYVTEEFARRMSEETSGGRRIVDAPTGEYHDKQIEAEVDRQKAGNTPAPPLQKKMERPKGEDTPPAASVAASQQEPPKTPPVGDIIVDWSENEASPTVRGDLGNVLPVLEKHCTLSWVGDWWHCLPKDVETIRQMCEAYNYRLTEILPKASSAPVRPLPPADAPAAEGERKKPAASSSPAVDLPPVGEPGWVTGVIEQANPESGKAPRVNVLFKIGKAASFWMSCFDKAIFPPLIAGKGKQATLIIQRRKKEEKVFTNIIGLKRVGSTEYDEDGKTPVVQQRDREAGGKTLFGDKR